MSFPSSYTDILATTIENRSGKVADNVLKSNALLYFIKKNGNVKLINGGSQIVQELSFAENGNFSWYSGADLLSVGSSDVISAAFYPWRQAACAVTLTGLEELQNGGEQAVIDLMGERLKVAESTMANNLCGALYSDGTGAGGKQVAGLAAALLAVPTSGVYGGIDRSTAAGSFWRNQATGSLGAQTAGQTFLTNMTKLYLSQKRQGDQCDLILADNTLGSTFYGSLQPNQRFEDPKLAEAGFENVKFMGAAFVVDGGIGGFAPANIMWFLNTKHMMLKVHAKRNMKPIAPKSRESFNQDIMAQIIGWAGNLVFDNLFTQGYFQAS